MGGFVLPILNHALTNLWSLMLSIVLSSSMLNISDHNLVRAWFKIGNTKPPITKKKTINEITWISRDQARIDLCAENFKQNIGKKHSFKKCMTKVRSSVEFAMRRRLRRRPGGKKKIELKAAPWVDSELQKNIKLRSKLSKAWRHARKRKKPLL